MCFIFCPSWLYNFLNGQEQKEEKQGPRGGWKLSRGLKQEEEKKYLQVYK